MKKLRYYAPYWVTAIVIVAIIVTVVLLRIHETPTLYDYALTMENSDYFISNDRSIWQLNEELENGYISVTSTEDEAESSTKNYTEEENSAQMSLYEFALAAHRTVYIRQDGSVWADMGANIATEIKAIDYDLTDISRAELSASLRAAQPVSALYAARANAVQLNLTSSGNTAILSPYAYLFVQLEDGKWYQYINASEHNVTVSGEYVYYRDHVEIDHDPNLQPGTTATYILNFPRNQYITNTNITGHYCIAVFSNAYYDYRRSAASAVYTTYPIPENAELIATVEFDLVAKNEVDYTLTNIKSSIDDLTLP